MEIVVNMRVESGDADPVDPIRSLLAPTVPPEHIDLLCHAAIGMAYHVAVTLALQKFFLGEPHHQVPALLVYDQPSQVYFRKRAAGEEVEEPEVWRDQDVVAVRKVFELLGDEVNAAKGRLQIIVLDHADDGVWGGLAGVELTEEWRGRALVPYEWTRSA